MRQLELYSDGSDLKHTTGRLGCGAVLVDPTGSGMGTKLGELSLELTPEKMKSECGTDKVSNPTAEMMGVLEALRYFKEDLRGITQLTVYADYIGVRDWCSGKWKTKEPYIATIKEKILKEIQSLGLTGRVKFEWVKGHQSKSILSRDAYWNSVADKLANPR